MSKPKAFDTPLDVSTVRDAIRMAMVLHDDGDYWKNYLSGAFGGAHIRNALTSNDYLDDMRHAERRRGNGFTPKDRARLDMPTEALFSEDRK